MQGSSRESMKALREALTTDTSESDAQTLAQVSDELFAVVSLLSSNGALRRALTDPAMGSDLKQRLVDNLLTAKGSGPTPAPGGVGGGADARTGAVGCAQPLVGAARPGRRT